MPRDPWESNLIASAAYLLALFSNSCGAKLIMILPFNSTFDMDLNYYGVNLYCVRNKIIWTKSQGQFNCLGFSYL